MTQALQAISNDEWSVMTSQATALVGTGFLPQAIKTPEQALAIIMTGRELGIGPMAALSTINVIQGKPAVSPQLMLALINRSGQMEDMQLATGPDGASCTMKRRGRKPYTSVFGPAEAKAMGLAEKDNYKKQAATMFKWRAVADAARTVFPDVVLGLYTPEEMGAELNVTDSGDLTFDAPEATAAPAQPAAGDFDRKKAIAEIGDIFRELNAKGHKPKWTATTINLYVKENFLGRESVEGLTNDELKTLSRALSRMLDTLLAEGAAEKSLAGGASAALNRSATAAQEGGRS